MTKRQAATCEPVYEHLSHAVKSFDQNRSPRKKQEFLEGFRESIRSLKVSSYVLDMYLAVIVKLSNIVDVVDEMLQVAGLLTT